MKRKLSILGMMTLFAVLTGMVAPTVSGAQSTSDKSSSHRQKTKNGWRNAAIGSGALGAYGLIKGDNKLAILGAAGAVYSGQRYEHDRRSQAALDSRHHRTHSSYIWRNHKRYRQTVFWSHGKKHVRTVRA